MIHMAPTPSDESPAVPGREEDFGWHLGVVLRAYQSSVLTALGDFPHGPRGYQTLANVLQGDHPSQLALAAHLGIDRTVMTYLIDDLVDAGLVERRQNPADRRQRKIVATAAGIGAFTDLEQRVRQAENIVLGALAPAERETLRGLLGRVACDVRDVQPAMDPCQLADEVLADPLPDGATRSG